ncbi:MAG: nucleotidyltransferase domain-containing protein [Candidatus Woesearchaeota archaeon]
MLDFLKIHKHSRKIFGKKELEIIGRQLKGMQLSQSERNRLSRDIRPKLQFIKDIGKYESEFMLKQNQVNENIIEKAVAAILDDLLNKQIQAILLFGSFAEKSHTRQSDIDICVVFNKVTLKEATEFRIRISGQLQSKVDVQVFNILPQKVKRSIALNHKILFQRQNYDNIDFSIRHLKEEGYFFRMRDIFGVET